MGGISIGNIIAMLKRADLNRKQISMILEAAGGKEYNIEKVVVTYDQELFMFYFNHSDYNPRLVFGKELLDGEFDKRRKYAIYCTSRILFQPTMVVVYYPHILYDILD